MAMRSSAPRTVAANESMSPRSASPTRSGRNAVRIGWASTAYGARKKTNATWYATTPPATELADDERGTEQDPRVGVQQHAPRREPRAAGGCRGPADSSRGRSENPLRRAATTKIATNAMTPPVPAITRSNCSVDESTRVGSGPATMRNAMSAATMTMVLPIGAAAVIANRRRA